MLDHDERGSRGTGVGDPGDLGGRCRGLDRESGGTKWDVWGTVTGNLRDWDSHSSDTTGEH
jgi:hypothetical protein